MATSFTVTLTGDQEVPARPTTASGSGTVAWNPGTSTADYRFTVTGLDFGPATGTDPVTPDTTADDVTNAHFHNAARGVNGPVVFGQIGPAQDPDLQILLEPADVTQNGDDSWTISGDWTPSDPANVSITSFAAALTAARAGEEVPLYFNVHTTTWPGGEIRGQLVAADGGGTTTPPPQGGTDWNALAAAVQANFAATGRWFASDSSAPSPSPGPVEWDALAAQVTANFEATGQWFA